MHGCGTRRIAEEERVDMVYTNAFIGKAKKPTEREVTATLGDSKALWDALLSELKMEFQLKQEWNSYSMKAGWALRLKRGERNVVYLSPARDSFRVSFVLGDKAVNMALERGLPARVVKLLQEAKRYPEGRGVLIDVKGAPDIALVVKLARIKLEN